MGTVRDQQQRGRICRKADRRDQDHKAGANDNNDKRSEDEQQKLFLGAASSKESKETKLARSPLMLFDGLSYSTRHMDYKYSLKLGLHRHTASFFFVHTS